MNENEFLQSRVYFKFWRTWWEMLQAMTPGQAKELVFAIVSYQMTGEVQEMNEPTAAAFKMIRRMIDSENRAIINRIKNQAK